MVTKVAEAIVKVDPLHQYVVTIAQVDGEKTT